MSKNVAILGGGAAGFFAAVNTAEKNPTYKVTIFEATSKLLSKVIISGGGRCNVTNYTLDPKELVTKYPRGGRELLGPFNKFAPNDTMKWFTSRGVELKVEGDNRVFPMTDSSSTVSDLLINSAKKAGVKIMSNERVKNIEKDYDSDKFIVSARSGKEIFDFVLIASGGSEKSFELAASLGHSIVSPVPSLFTFEIEHELIKDLAGLAFNRVEATLFFNKKAYKNIGPLLITHWGLSGPAILVLSSWCARELCEANYHSELQINFLTVTNIEQAVEKLNLFRNGNLNKKICNAKPFDITNSFWERILSVLQINQNTTWQEASKKNLQDFARTLVSSKFQIRGKGKFKEEFVTAGGVALKEVDFRTMESKICKGLYFAGEVLDIDGVTGGFNFQSAWTTAWIASQSI